MSLGYIGAVTQRRPPRKHPTRALCKDRKRSARRISARRRLSTAAPEAAPTDSLMCKEDGKPEGLGRSHYRIYRRLSSMSKGLGPSRPTRLLRVAVPLVLLAGVALLSWSFVGAMAAPGNAPADVRIVDWISNDLPGGRQVVLATEHFWYSWHTPPVGGTPKGGLPTVSNSRPTNTASTASSSRISAPKAITPLVANRLLGEGQWQTVDRAPNGAPAVRVAFLRPDAVHTSLVVGVMWMDTTLLQAALVPGTVVPGHVSSWPGLHFSIPAHARARLAATFNSGFLLRDSGGGWYGEGKSVAPLVNGMASLVIFKDGTATVAQWGRDATMNARVAAVRQNLELIVDQGLIVSGTVSGRFKPWGKTLDDTALVWRSGVGVTRDGSVVYVAGPGLSVSTLAEVLRRAGAVRAMELDINAAWTSAYYYSSAADSGSDVSATKLLTSMMRSGSRYLVPDERDFVAMFFRTGSALP
jgi:hypothetical protein